MTSDHDIENNIPILTEIISTRSGTAAISNAKEELRQPQAMPLNQKEFVEQLEKTLRENVLRQLLTRVDFVLEHRIKDGLAEVLQTAVDNLTNDIRQGLNKSLEELIHRTISQEISKIQSLKSK